MDQLAVDVHEAARLVSVSVYTIRRAIKRQELGCVRIGRRVLVPTGALEKLLERRERSANREDKPNREAAG